MLGIPTEKGIKMEKLIINLENCYGIKKLEAEFDFSALKNADLTHNANIVYAANGSMKSSLARVFKDIVKDQDPSDRVFKKRKPFWSIKDENGDDIPKENIYVIPPLPDSYSFEETSFLLANEDWTSQNSVDIQ